MFGRPALHSRSPHFEGASLHISAHELNGLTFTYAKLRRDGIKWRAVFPCHFDDSIYFLLSQFLIFLHALQTLRRQ